MIARKTFRIAVRRFGPFESAIEKQWNAFDGHVHTGLALDVQAYDLETLSGVLFAQKALVRGECDVALLNTDWLATARSLGAIVDLAPFLTVDPPVGFPDAWSPSLLRAQAMDGQILGLPYHDGPECLIYRKDLFDDPTEQRTYEAAFGSPLKVPETWPEFRQVARFFHRPEQCLFGTVFAAYPDCHNIVYDFLLQLWTRGGELLDDSERFQFATPEASEALRFYRDILGDSSAVHPRCAELDSVDAGLTFVDGQVAMMVNWFGFAVMAETIDSSRVRGCVDVAAVPHGENCASASMNVYWVLAIAAGSVHRETAYQFLRHCVSAGMDKLLTLEGAVGCRKSTWVDPEVNRSISFFNRLESIHDCARELPRMVQWPRVAAVINNLVLETIRTQKPVEELITNAQLEVNSLLREA